MGKGTRKPGFDRSYRERIIQIVGEHPNGLSCKEICDMMVERFVVAKKDDPYFAGGISTTCAALIKNNTFIYADEKTPRGGHIYKLR